MKQEELLYQQICESLIDLHADVSAGKMMSSPAITCNGKVFAFLSRKYRMVFKLGKTFDPYSQHFVIKPFNPFVKKGPLPGWFEVPFSDASRWEPLAKEALNIIRGH